MKILVPCDFSKISNNAALYAANFAKKINAEIILFHATHFVHPSDISVEFKEDEIFSKATKNCDLLTDKLKTAVKDLQISSKVVKGFPMETLLEDYAAHNEIDLIIMGTKGATGLKKALFGSNAVNVINRSATPVITVPEYARFRDLKHLVYASDTSIVSEMRSRIQKIISLAQPFDAAIYILHVLPQYRQEPNEINEEVDVIKIKTHLIDEYKYKNISFHVSYNDDIVEAICDFIADTHADLLAMFTHDITFFENVFNTSVSRNMAFHNLVPLLTIKN